jgi:uncharacterized protein DUF1707
VSEFQSSDIRISDSEREDALGKLGEHMSQGRLDIDEYGDRSARVATAKTRGELLALFGDLPEPRPAFGRPTTPAPAPPRSLVQKVAPVVLPVVAIAVIFALTFLLRFPFILLVPIVYFTMIRGRNQDPRRSDAYRRGMQAHQEAMREHREAVRDHNRQLRRQWRDGRY